ncbi:aspartyl protease family protein At5g10770-like [Selaginella moellendorffii]|uniref:aspartyl protease family protein At5g10770-like n=1 Tax=Selaginella moellendorffii TaxID=88036 RepID=UPI000D1C48BF|nr:aspartyl protease family protein At5g10770-like [Selaginella moellendorffii]|eukprot:XP_024537212.1 aspartyl protease family protein At5g10770-like [Selaginella moellendorffii]
MGVAAWKRRRTPANSTEFLREDEGLEMSFYVGNGLNFAMNLNLGTPPVQHNFTMALNSEFFWAACSPCIDCNVSTNEPLFSWASSTSYTRIPCTSPFCSTSPDFSTNACGSSAVGFTTCLYNVSYSPKYSSAGEMASDVGTPVEFRTWFLLDDVAENATVCLAVGDSQKVGFSLNVIGTYQQLDVTVEFDLEKQEIGFGTAGCMNLDTSSGFTYVFVWKSSTTQAFSFLPLLTYLLLV